MKSSLKTQRIALEGLVLFTMAIGMVLVSSSTKADSSTDKVTWTIQPSCTMSSNIPSGSEHTASMMSGEHKVDIGTTTVTVVCNDSEGLDIYAVGSSNNKLGNTNLISNLGSDYNIPTGVYSNGNTNSSWSMKLTNMNDGLTPVSGKFGNYISVPSTWDKVAYRDSSTGATAGSSFQTTYDVYASSAQPAGTYTGQVKYIVVHPHNTVAPPMKTISDLEYMQDFASLSSTEKTDVLNSMTPEAQYQLKDNRDQKDYYISKLADGNVWMTQNLDFDIVNGGANLDSTNTDVPSNWVDAGQLTNTYATGTTTWDTTSTGYTTPQSYNPGDLCWSGTLQDSTPVSCSQNGNHYHLGNYYNWTAAVAMNNSGSYTTGNTGVDQSICPAGWALPNSGNQTETGSFRYLVSQYGWTDSAYWLNNYTMWNDPLYFPLGGLWNGYLLVVGNYGFYWSSVVSDSGSAYGLAFYYDGGSVEPAGDFSRGVGLPVRCVAR